MENINTSPRYAGQLDPEFTQQPDIPGWVDILRALDWPAGRDLFFSSVAPTPDGHLYACGYFAETVSHPVEYFIARLQGNGQRDSAFGSDGVIRGTFPINFKMIIPTRLVVQDDGKILMQALGYAGSPELADPVLLVARFLATGAADVEFGEQGLMRKDLPPGKPGFLRSFVGDLQQLPDGRILASTTGVRTTAQGAMESAIVYRLTTQGELDGTFNGNGIKDFAPPGASLRVSGFVVQPDGKMVLAGQVTHEGSDSTSGMFVRLDEAGQLDETFGPLGTGFFEFSLEDYQLHINSIAMSPDGSLVGVGAASAVIADQGLIDQGFIIGITAEGFSDVGFNNGTLLLTPINERYSADWVSAQFQRDGKLLVAGRSMRLVAIHDSYVYVARFNSDGTPDINFGDSETGRVETPVGGFNDIPLEMRQQTDGRILVGVNANSLRKGTLLRYLNG
ncbi:hypothetical protein AABC73_02310 [Pseudomonas sp. G.S.17]|uniref:hypothetical protein n=1 Tax=Pseudomonas sp. G.S.17 TaxID=3137451 RepID=UPI00311CDE25